MKEKKLYKIAFMGDKDHGCDIISTLESWGGSNYYLRTGNDPEYVYFINVLGTIDVIHNSKMLSKGMENFYFMFWHDYNIECHLKVGESINYGGQDYDVDGIMFDANNRCIVYVLKLFGIGVEYITNNELIPTEKYQTEEENNEYLFKNNMIKKLAIKGHATRGKEVIELLEMMGGNTFNSLMENAHPNRVYYIGKNNAITWMNIYSDNGCLDTEDFFTLEEFLEKYPFKVGDKVFLYDNITEGCVTGMKWDEDKGTVKYCVYTSAECWCDVKELLKWNNVDLVERHYMDNMEEKDKAKAPDIKGEDYSGKRFGYKIPDGYEFDVVVDGKIFLKPIKPKYPKTYVECCEVLRISKRVQLSYTYPDVECSNAYLTGEKHLLDAFIKLRICRNAYWKIVGEEMGLDKPWEPKFGKTILFDITFYLYKDNFVLHKGEYPSSDNCILVFPTEEMRDAFYENFKDLIEQCKELL